MNQLLISMIKSLFVSDILHTSWKFAATTHFLALFNKPLRIKFDTVFLEESIIQKELSEEIAEVYMILVKSVTGNRNVDRSTWSTFLYQLGQKWKLELMEELDIDSLFEWNFSEATILERVNVMYW